MTADTFDAERRSGSTRLLSPTDVVPITPGVDNYAFGVALALQCNGGGSLTVKTRGGTSRTVTLVDGGILECPTIACTAFSGTGLFAYA